MYYNLKKFIYLDNYSSYNAIIHFKKKRFCKKFNNLPRVILYVKVTKSEILTEKIPVIEMSKNITLKKNFLFENIVQLKIKRNCS